MSNNQKRAGFSKSARFCAFNTKWMRKNKAHKRRLFDMTNDSFHGKKYFSQDYTLENGDYHFELQMWEPTTKLLWEINGYTKQESLNAFLKEPVFDGKTFWEAEKEMDWVDF